MAFEKVMQNFLFVSPTIFRIVRVARVGRILRLVKGARGIRTLLFALAISLPALMNVGFLLMLVIFIFGVFGMNFFMYVRYDAFITPIFNFETVVKSMLTLFPLCTSAGWSGVFRAITNDAPPFCDPTIKTHSQIAEGNCGNSGVAHGYIVTYIIINFLVIANMYKAVILENFSSAREEVQVGLTDDDYDMFYEVWQKFDPKGTEYIILGKLSDFVASLEEPLGIPKPNKTKLISMNLPICEGFRIHCTDILDALTKNFLGGGEEIEQTAPELLKKDRPSDYKPFTTTIEFTKQDNAARVITRFVRRFKDQRKAMKEAGILPPKWVNKSKKTPIIDETSYLTDASPVFERLPKVANYDTSEVSDMDSEFDRIFRYRIKPKRNDKR